MIRGSYSSPHRGAGASFAALVAWPHASRNLPLLLNKSAQRRPPSALPGLQR